MANGSVPFHRPKSLPPEIKDKIPHHAEAEAAILATIFRDNNTLRTARDILRAEDFFTPKDAGLSLNGKIFLAMIRLADSGAPIDVLTVIEDMRAEALDAAYIHSLDDPLNSACGTTFAHYVRLVREKAIQRKVLHKSYALAERILAGDAESAELGTDLELFVREALRPERKEKLFAVDVREFLFMSLTPKEYFIEPILPARGSGMIYAPTGSGKTYIMLHLAYSLAIGVPKVFVWDIPKPRRVVYVEGEMDGQDLQERLQEIVRGFGTVFPDANRLRIIASDLPGQTAAPRINSAEGRKQIEDHLTGDELLILDNLSALCPSADEEESGEWSQIQEWILSLRRHGVGTFLVHHPGKSGTQLGTSKKEFQLSCNLRVKLPSNYDLADGLRVEVRLDKLRSRGTGEFNPAWAQPFEISLRTEGEPKTAIFAHRPLKELVRQRVVEMLQAGMRPNDVALETGLDRYAIYRIRKKLSMGDTNPE